MTLVVGLVVALTGEGGNTWTWPWDWGAVEWRRGLYLSVGMFLLLCSHDILRHGLGTRGWVAWLVAMGLLAAYAFGFPLLWPRPA